ncbi:unnamed protein product [Musa acuminata subsp. burmannicoides]
MNLVYTEGLLRLAEEGDAAACLGRENVDKGIGMAVEGDGGRGFEELAVGGAEDPDVVVGAGGGSDGGVVLVYQRRGARTGSASSPPGALQILLLVLHVLILDLDELQLALQGLQAPVEVVVVAMERRGGDDASRRSGRLRLRVHSHGGHGDAWRRPSYEKGFPR